MKKIFRKIVVVKELIIFLFMAPLSFIYNSKKDIHLFSERGYDARDNGYQLFKFYRINYPSIPSYFIITKDSPDYDKVKEIGNVIKFKSFKHYLIYIFAKYKISTHLFGGAPDSSVYHRLNQKKLLKGKFVFLQHGIIKDDIPFLYREATNLDLFICGAKPEYDFVNRNFHYENQVKYTGLARFDNLHDFSKKNQILIMPTWRKFLSNCSKEEFEKSEYYIKWNEVLQDSKLIAYLKNFSMELLFYPHIEIQKYIASFKSKSDNIIIADFRHYDVQTLLKESKLLITDFSSVFFDFAYMKKPIIYYQFDSEAFFVGHYNKGYFEYNEMGFGEVENCVRDVVDKICYYIERNFEIEQKYLERIKVFFPIHDVSNCKRIFDEIERL